MSEDAAVKESRFYTRVGYYLLFCGISAAGAMLACTYRAEMTSHRPFFRIIHRIHEERELRRKEREQDKADRKAERDEWEQKEHQRLLDFIRRRRTGDSAPADYRVGGEHPVAKISRARMDHETWENCLP